MARLRVTALDLYSDADRAHDAAELVWATRRLGQDRPLSDGECRRLEEAGCREPVSSAAARHVINLILLLAVHPERAAELQAWRSRTTPTRAYWQPPE